MSATDRFDPDPIDVDDPRVPEPFTPPSYEPRSVRGCLMTLAIFVAVLACSAAPSSGQTTDRIDLSPTSSAALSGAPHMAASLAVTGSGAPQPTGAVGTALIGGWASWYDVGPGFYAAAGPELRAALGSSWRHTIVEVVGPARASVLVELTDSCACGDRHGMPTFLDLSADAFAALAPLKVGIVAVSIEISPALPRTDADLRMMLEVRGDELYR